MNVLIADDSAIARRLHKRVLVSNGIPESNIFEVPDGVEALKIAMANKIDFFLLDWNMPNLDGLSFVKKIRTLDIYKRIPVVMVTSDASKKSVLEAVQAGITDYIIKPVRDEVLWEKVKTFMQE